MALEQMQKILCSNRVCNKYCSLIALLTETSDLPKLYKLQILGYLCKSWLYLGI
jgi:hypothetical protein